jgi:hypothetical protein
MVEAKVLILGAYSTREGYKGNDPDICLKRLEGIQQHLKEKGFIHTRLVKDWRDEDTVPDDIKDVHFLRKSIHYIDTWAEIMAFVFLADGNPISVTTELAHVVETSKGRCDHCFVLREEGVRLGILRGHIKGNGIVEFPFTDDMSLHKSAFSGCFSILYDSL